MSSKNVIVAAAVLIAAGMIAVIVHNSRKDASMLLVNGVVYTLDQRHPQASAVAIRGDRIAAIGTTDELQSAYHADTIIDLKGKAVYPGFIDSHAHLEALGAALMNLDLSGSVSEEDAAARVRSAMRDTVHGGWIRGRGWDQNRWPRRAFPTKESLDRVCPDIPVYLRRVDGHAAWVNSKALSLAGIDAQTPDPDGGKIIRDAHGRPSGVFIDRAVEALESVLPPPSELERSEAIRRAVAECIACGLTEVHDMGVDSAGIAIYQRMINAGQFPFRVYAAVQGSLPDAWAYYRSRGPLTTGYGGRLVVRALKLYADGALGSRGAALLEPYADDPENRGLTLTSRAELLTAAREALASGFQLCTHAIGDRANAIVLDVYQEALGASPKEAADARFRIEHAQVLSPGDIIRFKKLGVIPVMQASHCTSDMPWAESRLGPKRIKGAYAWRSLRDQGCVIPGWSDFPVESPNPLWGFYAAITRQDKDGNPPGGWYPEQCLTRQEALLSYTMWAAQAGFQEKEKGSLEVGKWADLVVLSRDIMTIDPREILTTRVAMTIIAGTVVYAAPDQPGVAAR
ncbi:MAG TPA: amidohydrolase [Bacteroidota bacterium]|nr:amidohydrolase [Bacteroidota bacterium]